MEEKKGMPLWAKIVIGIVIVMVFMCGGGLFIGYKMFGGITKGFTDDKTKLAIARSICDLDLPPDFKIAMGMDIGGMKMALFACPSRGDQQVFFIALPPDSKGKNSIKELKNSFDDPDFANALLGQNSSGRSMKIEKIKSKSKAVIKGHDFPYALCDYDNKGKKMEGIIGVFYCPDTTKGFMVLAMNDPGKYDNEMTMKLMQSLKCH